MHNEKICELIDAIDGCAGALKSHIKSDGTFDMDITTKMRLLCLEIKCDVNQLDGILESMRKEAE